MHVFCEDCGAEVDPCGYCNKRRSRGMGSYCDDCYHDFGYAHQNFYPNDPEVMPLFLCSPCESVRNSLKQEIVGYLRWAADYVNPLSPTNVHRHPQYRKIGDKPTDRKQREKEAQAAYDEEMAFSGSEEEAKKIYDSFFENQELKKFQEEKRLSKPIRPGFVSMEEILKGQHVTGEQFFQAYREAQVDDLDEFYDEEDMGNNPKTMSLRMLRKAYEQVCDDRKYLSRRCKKEGWTPDDETLMEAMNDWAKKVFDELLSR